MFRSIIQYFYPQHLLEKVTDLTPDLLREWGIDHLLLDVDCTLKAYSDKTVSPEVQTWLDQLRSEGFGLCIISNGRGKRIEKFAATLDLPWFAPAMKPSPRGCRKAMKKFNFDPARTAMVGDQIFADILAGRRAGIMTVLVKPIRPWEEPWFARIKRPFEKIVFRFGKTE